MMLFSIKHTAIIYVEEKQKLWKAGVTNLKNNWVLFRVIFYYFGKVCCFRAGLRRAMEPEN